MKEQLGNNLENQISPEQEKKERPHYRFYFHGTFNSFLEHIDRDGFKYNEYDPSLTISPSYGFKFIEGELAKGEKQLKNRGKHLDEEKKSAFDPANLKNDRGVLLVIEPPKELNIHTTNQGRPNIFSTPDQVPEDLDSAIRARVFINKQYEVRGTPFTQIRSGEIKHPGMSLSKKRTLNEQGEAEWQGIEKTKRLHLKGGMPAENIKMVIEKNEIFENILKQFKNRLVSNKELSSDFINDSKKQIIEYLHSDNVKIKAPMTDQDLAELADNMLMGEIEQFIVAEIRTLYLLSEKSQGKKIYNVSGGKEVEIFADKSQEQLTKTITEKIDRLRNLNPDNEVLKRYIEIYCQKFETETEN